MELPPQLAQELANITMGWYTHCLDDAQSVTLIESALRSSGHPEWIMPDVDWPEAHSPS